MLNVANILYRNCASSQDHGRERIIFAFCSPLPAQEQCRDLLPMNPCIRDQELVVALSPVPNQMNVWHTAPCNRTGVLRHDDLKLRRDGIEERGKRAEDAMHAFYIGRAISIARRVRCLLDRWPCFGKIHLARLVYHEEISNRTVVHTQEVLMQSKYSSNMIANPILAAANFPKKICSSR